MIHVSPSMHTWLSHLTLSNVSIAVAIEFLLAFGCGALMEKKGRNSVAGFLIAFFLGPFGIAAVLMTPASRHVRARIPKHVQPHERPRAYARHIGVDSVPPHLKVCPYCSVRIPRDADECRVCQSSVGSRVAV